MRISGKSRRPRFASSRSTGPGAGRTWRCSNSCKATLKGEPIDVYGHGRMQRDFTYIDDLVEAIVAADRLPAARGRAGRRQSIRSRPRRPIASSISAADSRSGCSISSTRSRRASGLPVQRRFARDAEGRCAGNLRLAGPPESAHRLRAVDADRDGREGVRRMVSGVLRGLSLAAIQLLSPANLPISAASRHFRHEAVASPPSAGRRRSPRNFKESAR